MTLAIDGGSAEFVRDSLELELDTAAAESDLGAQVFDAGGGYAPTVGILGAVLGLIHVMENLSEPEKLGAGIAVAFVATVYGVGIANLFLLPMAGKIRVRNQVMSQRYEFIIEAVVSIVKGDNPAMMSDRLRGLLSSAEGRGRADDGLKTALPLNADTPKIAFGVCKPYVNCM